MPANKTVSFIVKTDARWWLAVNRRDVPLGNQQLQLPPREEPYLMFFYFQGEPGSKYEVRVAGAKLLQPVKGEIPEGWTREGGVADLKV